MGSHVWRPLYVVLLFVACILLFRTFYVPKDFGIGERGYMYSWHRKGNETDWKNFKVKYRTREYCKDCHEDKFSSIMDSPHRIINCENCHGAAVDHPENPAKLNIDRSRTLCLRCHFPLAYPTSGRSKIKGVDPDKHNPDYPCVMCHNPHRPNLKVR